MNATQHASQPNGRVHQKPDAGLSEYVFGKLQPQSLPLEEAVLGALMIERDAILQVIDFLRPEHFYLESHQQIFAAAVRLFERSEPIDLLTMPEELKRVGKIESVGGSYYLVDLSSRVASAANVEYHARIIYQKWMNRQLIRIGTNAVRDGYEDGDCFEAMDKTESELFKVASGATTSGPKSAGQLISSVVRKTIDARSSGDSVTGVNTGFNVLNYETGGWQPSDLIVVAARPGMGKTAWALSGAVEEAKAGLKVLVFSLEMSAAQLVQRIASFEARIESSRLRDGRITDSDERELMKQAEALANLPLYIDDTPAISVNDLRARARRHKMQHGLDIVFVDYLQLMTGSRDERTRGANREQEIASISRGLKATAKELDVPIVALAQLSRAVEARSDKRPQLSDLRESGAIENDADIVGFIFRPEYYESDDPALSGVAEFILAKHRNGRLGPVQMQYEKEYTRFSDIPKAKPASVNYSMPRHEPADNTPF